MRASERCLINGVEHHQCSACGCWKPSSLEHWNGNGRGRLKCTCKDCQRTRARERYRAAAAARAAGVAGSKPKGPKLADRPRIERREGSLAEVPRVPSLAELCAA